MVQIVAGSELSGAIVGYSCLRSGSIFGGFGKSSLISITVCGQLNNFDTISFIVHLCIDYFVEYGAQSQSGFSRTPLFMVDLKTHFSSDYLNSQLDFELRPSEEELQPHLSSARSSTLRKASGHFFLLGTCMIIHNIYYLHDTCISYPKLPYYLTNLTNDQLLCLNTD